MSPASVPCQSQELPLSIAVAGLISEQRRADDPFSEIPVRFRIAFLAAGIEARARALALLLPHVGTMALLVIGNGHFARFAAPSPPASTPVTPQEAAQVDARTIIDLVCYLEQREPQVTRQVLAQL